ncbi:hypothetical protein F4776DRAFT_122707 [Hypoxylon sp. NC0597]|nr:hypothetical protein F4776DRAFT_122707 [Hypoxylon sp. NC0597]
MFRSVFVGDGNFSELCQRLSRIDLQRNATPEMAGLLPIQTVPPRATIKLPFSKLRSGVDACKRRDLHSNAPEAVRTRSRCPSSLQIEAPASSEPSSLIRSHPPLFCPESYSLRKTRQLRTSCDTSRRYIHFKQRFALRGCTTARGVLAVFIRLSSESSRFYTKASHWPHRLHAVGQRASTRIESFKVCWRRWAHRGRIPKRKRP